MQVRQRHWAITLALIYAFQLGAGFAYSYFPRYLATLGLGAAAIGMLLSVTSVARSVSMPVWSWFADFPDSEGEHRGRRFVQVLFVLASPFLLLPFIQNPWIVGSLLVWSSLTLGSTLPILDVVTMRELGAGAFGRIRAWGSLGFGLTAGSFALAGLWLTHEALALLSPWVIVVGTLAAGFAAFSMPASSPVQEYTSKASWKDFLVMLRNPWILVLMPLWSLHWASQMPYNVFIVFFAEEQGFASWAPGAAVALGIAAEIAFLARGQTLIDRLGPTLSFGVMVIFTALRWILSAFALNSFVFVALQVLHGLSFGGFMLSMMAVLNKEVDPKIRTSAQSLLYVIVFGVGGAIGQALSGWILDESDGKTLFLAAGGLELLVCVPTLIIIVGYRMRGRHRRVQKETY
ncbi:MFS transporter [Microvenator marinus]|uniref:MFS transporter n=1 Tax=Microvenator marinus TaxID=2600177 RepID=UPI00201B5923|nr:MFS transporter [Microvenator marinus]